MWSDLLLRRGWSLTASRKTPIVAGMAIAMSIILCNFVDAQWLVVVVMAFTFFGKGIGALVFVGQRAGAILSFLVIVPETERVVLPGTMAA